MKKIYLLISLIIFSTIASSLFLNKKTTTEIEIVPNVQESVNPNGEEIRVISDDQKILGESTEKTDREVKQADFEAIKLYSLINSYRKDNKLTPLNINQSLEVSSKRKVEDMIENNYFSHQDENNNESWYLFRTSGYEFKTAGENLSTGINSPWQVFQAWIESPVHNAQLLNGTYLDMGLTADCESYKIAKRSSCIVVLHLGSR